MAYKALLSGMETAGSVNNRPVWFYRYHRACSPVKARRPLPLGGFLKTPPSPQEISRKGGQRDQQGVADPTWAKTGEVHHGIGHSIGGVEQVEKERPSPKAKKPIADRGMQHWRDGFGGNSHETGRFGAKEREEVLGIVEDDDRVIDGAQEKKGAEEANVMPLLPLREARRREPTRPEEPMPNL